MSVGIHGAAVRLGISKDEVLGLVEEGALKEVSPGKISLNSIYEFSGLNPGGNQTKKIGGRPTEVLNVHEASAVMGLDIDEVNKLVSSGKLELVDGAHGKRGIRQNDAVLYLGNIKQKEKEVTMTKIETMTVKEAMEQIGMAESTLYYHIKKGTLKKIGSHLDAQSVKDFIASRDVEQKPKATTDNANDVTDTDVGDTEEEEEISEKIGNASWKETDAEHYGVNKMLNDVFDSMFFLFAQEQGRKIVDKHEETILTIEDEFFKKHPLGTLYTEEEVKEAVTEAYRRGMEAVYRKIKGAA